MKCFTRAALVVCAVLCITTGALGQERVQVIKDRSPIVAANLVTIISTVDVGAELVLIQQQGNWIEVLLPGLNPRRSTGFIARVNVELVGGARSPGLAPDSPESAAPPAAVSETSPPPALPATERPEAEFLTSQGSAAPSSLLASGLRAFGIVGAGSFLARQSFDAVLGTAPILGQLRGPWFGGGAQFQLRRGLFLEGGISFFRQTGQRVFVDGDTVFALGIPDTLTLLPVTATVGYRFPARSVAPFIGGGVGQYLFSETTPFDESSERSWQRANSFHALGGVEFHVARGVSIAAQGQYTRTPDALTGAVGAVLGETDLGGLQFGVKVLVGRSNRVQEPELPDGDDSPPKTPEM
jgi:opacity protein-like surface antigen